MAVAVAATGRRRRGLPRVTLALPSWFWYVVFFVAPLAIIVVYSFGYKPGPGAASSIGLDELSLQNYRDTLGVGTLTVSNPGLFRDVFAITIRAALMGTILCFLVGFPVAYLLATRVSQRWRNILLALVIVPFWTSFLLRTFAWKILLAGNGPLSGFMQDVGLLDGPLRFLDTRGAVQLGLLYNYLPLMIFPLFVALDRLDPALREASKDLGAARVRTFFQVTIPLAMPGIVSGLLLVFIPLAGEYVTPSILGGAKGIMAGSVIASQFLEAQNWALGSAQAVVLILLILAVIAVIGIFSLIARTLIRNRRKVELGAVA